MIFTAYFDESGTHGDTPTIIMSAWLGHAYQWRRVEKKLKPIKEKFDFKVFHFTDWKNRTGEFRGWSEQKCDALAVDLIGILEKHLTQGVTVFLEHSRYMNEYKAPPVPRKMRLDSQYGVCFRACLSHIIRVVERHGNSHKLNVTIENGHRNVNDCNRIFYEFKEFWRENSKDVLGEFKIDRKDSSPPLMFADMLAAAHSKFRELKALNDLKIKELPLSEPPHKSAIATIELSPTALIEMKVAHEELKRLRVKYWQDQRAKR